jgi:hypothetical protein
MDAQGTPEAVAAGEITSTESNAPKAKRGAKAAKKTANAATGWQAHSVRGFLRTAAGSDEPARFETGARDVLQCEAHEATSGCDYLPSLTRIPLPENPSRRQSEAHRARPCQVPTPPASLRLVPC